MLETSSETKETIMRLMLVVLVLLSAPIVVAAHECPDEPMLLGAIKGNLVLVTDGEEVPCGAEHDEAAREELRKQIARDLIAEAESLPLDKAADFLALQWVQEALDDFWWDLPGPLMELYLQEPDLASVEGAA